LLTVPRTAGLDSKAASELRVANMTIVGVGGDKLLQETTDGQTAFAPARPL